MSVLLYGLLIPNAGMNSILFWVLYNWSITNFALKEVLELAQKPLVVPLDAASHTQSVERFVVCLMNKIHSNITFSGWLRNLQLLPTLFFHQRGWSTTSGLRRWPLGQKQMIFEILPLVYPISGHSALWSILKCKKNIQNSVYQVPPSHLPTSFSSQAFLFWKVHLPWWCLQKSYWRKYTKFLDLEKGCIIFDENYQFCITILRFWFSDVLRT